MAFKINARTILQLGAELISSDSIAFYELIKNAFDAGSANVSCRIVVRLDYHFQQEVIDKIEKFARETEDEFQILKFKNMLILEIETAVKGDSFEAKEWFGKLKASVKIGELLERVEAANYIDIDDTGIGMSSEELNSVYLTIGTTSKFSNGEKTHSNQHFKGRPVLGEKGIGRLSVMRLGEKVFIQTTKKDEEYFNVLKIDWSEFAVRHDKLLEEIEVEPRRGNRKENLKYSGTRIRIYRLSREWTRDDLTQIAREQLNRFVDPFSDESHVKEYRKFVKLWYNREPIIIPVLNRLLFEEAHAKVEAELRIIKGVPELAGTIDYQLASKRKQFGEKGEHLSSLSDARVEDLVNLGPFRLKFYYFNNALLQKVDGIGDRKTVLQLVKDWSGGLKVYRDGFRVFPYGDADDDWLKIDQKALASSGFKVNRRQIVGKVDISSIGNPGLVDQTNREGLRDTPSKATLVTILRYVLDTEFRTFLDAVEADRVTNELSDIDAIEARLDDNEQDLKANLNYLLAHYPQLREEPSLRVIQNAFTKIRSLFSDTKTMFETAEKRQNVTIHLAGLGLMVDVLAHELNRSTAHAVDTLSRMSVDEWSAESASLIKTLTSQLRTLQTRLKILDPLGPAGRQVKTFFSVSAVIRSVFLTRVNQFERHGISYSITEKGKTEWKIKGVEGMFVQLTENLLSNSVYWLKVRSKIRKDFVARITVTIDQIEEKIYFQDNGPGVDWEKREEVFLPWVSTKPPGEGKGLGLYISREIAKYHNVLLYLDEKSKSSENTLSTFIIDLSNIK